MKMSIEEFEHKQIIDNIQRQAYIDAGGQIPNARPMQDPNFKPLPTKSTEDVNTPRAPHFYNNEIAQAKAERLQGLLNQLGRNH